MWDESARAAFTDLLPAGHQFPEPDPERWYALIEDGAVSMLMAEEDGVLLGFSACGESRDDDAAPSVGELRSFFVAAGRWGRGVGRELMAAALESLRERGCAEATVWSFAARPTVRWRSRSIADEPGRTAASSAMFSTSPITSRDRGSTCFAWGQGQRRWRVRV